MNRVRIVYSEPLCGGSGGTLRAFVTYIFRAESAMSTYSPFGRGRRKFAEKFTSRQGLWLLGIVAVIMMAMMLLIVLGYMNVDID